jgi:hypothetical protein
MFGLVFIRYINDPIIYLYSVVSIKSDEASTNSFSFASMGVFMDLHSSMSNLFKISTVYSGEDILTQGKTTEDSGVWKVAEKTKNFDANKERQIFEEARKEFKGDRGSSSKTQ